MSGQVARPELKLDWCSYAAAKYAVMHWHYSRRMPMPPLVRLGVWEDGAFVGAVIFSRGANLNLGTAYGLGIMEVCELTRVALKEHVNQTSRIVAISIRLLRQVAPNLRLVVSYADPERGHHGGVYQAGNWVHDGASARSTLAWRDGRWMHQRVTATSFSSTGKPGTGADPIYADLPKRVACPKYRYLYPLDATMRAQIIELAREYPKRPPGRGAEAPTSERQGRTDPDAPSNGDEH